MYAQMYKVYIYISIDKCALLDLNLGPSQLSVQCWTSTWDLPSSVCTAGHQQHHPIIDVPLTVNISYNSSWH